MQRTRTYLFSEKTVTLCTTVDFPSIFRQFRQAICMYSRSARNFYVTSFYTNEKRALFCFFLYLYVASSCSITNQFETNYFTKPINTIFFWFLCSHCFFQFTACCELFSHILISNSNSDSICVDKTFANANFKWNPKQMWYCSNGSSQFISVYMVKSRFKSQESLVTVPRKTHWAHYSHGWK